MRAPVYNIIILCNDDCITPRKVEKRKTKSVQSFTCNLGPVCVGAADGTYFAFYRKSGLLVK